MPLYQLCCLVEEEVGFFLFFLEQQNVLFKILAAWKALKDLSYDLSFANVDKGHPVVLLDKLVSPLNITDFHWGVQKSVHRIPH